MKHISLLEVKRADLNGEELMAGREIVHGGIRYRILQVTTANVRRPKWKRRPTADHDKRYRLLVEAMPSTAQN